MKKPLSLLALGILSLLLIVLPPARAATPLHYTELDFPPPPEVTLPEFSRFELDNGMVVYLIEDRELPLVKGQAVIRTGSRWEDPDKVGLASIVGTTLRSGGTQQRSGDQLDQLLEQRAASIETRIGTTAGSASFNTLTQDTETVIALLAEILRQPAFAPDKIELAKKQREGRIARRNDTPDDIAGREFDKLIYGETSPYARTEEYATIANIDRDSVIEFYNRYFRPDRILLGIVGDFDTAQMRQLIQQTFGDWQLPPSTSQSTNPEPTQDHQGGIYFIDQPQLTQSTIRMGHLGGQLDSPDYATLKVMDGVLRGFGGRLFNEVRSRQGLAYSVYGVWNANYDYPGVFVMGGQTRSETTVPFIQSLRQEMERLQTTPLGDEELDYAKESILNSFIFNFQESSQTLSRLLRYEYYGYPQDFIFEFQRQVKATTADDVLAAARTYLNRDRLVTLVVGNSQGIEPPLSALEETITAIDITIPEPKS